jgi:hypothetical protein
MGRSADDPGLRRGHLRCAVARTDGSTVRVAVAVVPVVAPGAGRRWA